MRSPTEPGAGTRAADPVGSEAPPRREAVARVLLAVNQVRRGIVGRVRERGLGIERDVAYGRDAEQRLDLWRPVGVGTPPVIVLLHGGGWIQGSRRDFASLAPAFARAGVMAVAADYRLAPRCPWPAAHEDVLQVIAAIPRLGGDPTRVVLWGHSAGGHLALMAVRDPDAPRVSGVVALGAPADLELLDAGETQLARRVFGDRPLSEVSPLRLDPASPVPTLLVHGTADRVCDIVGARALTGRAEIELVEVPGGDHGLRWPVARCHLARNRAIRWALALSEPPPRCPRS